MMCGFSNLSPESQQFRDWLSSWLLHYSSPLGFVGRVPYYDISFDGSKIGLGAIPTTFGSFSFSDDDTFYYAYDCSFLFNDLGTFNRSLISEEAHNFLAPHVGEFYVHDYILGKTVFSSSFDDLISVVALNRFSSYHQGTTIRQILSMGQPYYVSDAQPYRVDYIERQYNLKAVSLSSCNLDYSPIVRLLGGIPA